MIPPALAGFERFSFSAGTLEHAVFCIGDRGCPPVLVLQELPGIGPGMIGFVHRLRGAGFRVYLPWLFGPVGRRTPLANYARLCISREFASLAAGISAPVTSWLRALAAHVSVRNDDSAVAVIGMCVTGAFVIPLLLDPRVKTAVAAQPAIPFSLGDGRRAAELNVSTSDIAGARDRLAAGEGRLMVVRCVADRFCSARRIQRLRREFPQGLTVREYGTSETRNAAGERPHATYTKELRLAPEGDATHYARRAFEDLLAFLRAGSCYTAGA